MRSQANMPGRLTKRPSPMGRIASSVRHSSMRAWFAALSTRVAQNTRHLFFDIVSSGPASCIRSVSTLRAPSSFAMAAIVTPPGRVDTSARAEQRARLFALPRWQHEHNPEPRMLIRDERESVAQKRISSRLEGLLADEPWQRAIEQRRSGACAQKQSAVVRPGDAPLADRQDQGIERRITHDDKLASRCRIRLLIRPAYSVYSVELVPEIGSPRGRGEPLLFELKTEFQPVASLVAIAAHHHRLDGFDRTLVQARRKAVQPRPSRPLDSRACRSWKIPPRPDLPHRRDAKSTDSSPRYSPASLPGTCRSPVC